MTRTEFINAYSDLARERRRATRVVFTPDAEKAARITDRNQAAHVWRRGKRVFESLTVDEWRKHEANS